MSVNYEEVKKAIKELLDSPESKKHDPSSFTEGSFGPILVRLAWHTSGTFNIFDKTGGSNGATMRFAPECTWGANAGLDLARQILEPIKQRFPAISYGDLWTLAGAVAVEHLKGPKINWFPGRVDALDGSSIVEDGRLPDATKGSDHIRAIFYRMGMSDREIVALIGCHCLGRAHAKNSGFDGPWTFSPNRFSNTFFTELFKKTWKETTVSATGAKQFTDETGKLMMLPADLALLSDPSFRKYAELYAKDKDAFFKDFSSAFSKLLALGVPAPSKL